MVRGIVVVEESLSLGSMEVAAVKPVLIEGSRDEVVLAGVTTLAAVVGAERKALGGEVDGIFAFLCISNITMPVSCYECCLLRMRGNREDRNAGCSKNLDPSRCCTR